MRGGRRIWTSSGGTRLLLIGLGVFFGMNATRLPGESSDEEKRLRELFLKSRQQMEVVPSPTPSAKPTPAPAPPPGRKPFRAPNEPGRSPGRTAPRATPKGGPRPEQTATAGPGPGATRPAGSASPGLDEEEEVMPEEMPETSPPPSATPTASAAPTLTPAPTPVPTASPTPKKRRRWFFFGPRDETEQSPAPGSNNRNGEPIVIEKSGGQTEKDLAPVPDHGFANRWRYLTPAVRRAIDDARVARGRWKYIVVHNSGTRQGNARIFDYYHRRIRRMPNGLAYHFVIGNGNSSGNGQIEVGNRWVGQLAGGHVHSDYLNYIGIGICLVGDFNRDLPTQAQYEALDELIRYLRQRVGKTDGRYAIVLGHREINPRPTDCPGNRFPLNWLHHTFPN